MAKSTNDVLQFVREDDYVEYFFYPTSLLVENRTNVDPVLASFVIRINEIVAKYASEYIWHKDPFKVAPKPNYVKLLHENETDESDFLPHLHGVTHFGENIDDEWFIVYLIIKITEEIPELCVRIIDSDGEFLLIEAANVLPKWANPESCEKRVFIYQGTVRLIDNSRFDDDVENCPISIVDAIEKIVTNEQIVSVTSMQDVIVNRIAEFNPENLLKKLHRVNIFVPIGVAAVLREQPRFIAPAIVAFCSRDPLDLRVCRAMKYFPPENRVMTSVVMTRHLYAMLIHTNYVPDRRTGWNLPPVTSPSFKAYSLGVKIACGFEILLSQAKPGDESLENDKAWHAFLTSLKNRGYFRDLLEHSKDYDSLMKQAEDYYREMKDSKYYTPVVGQEILELVHRVESNVDEFKNIELPMEDDDSWLNLDPNTFEQMLETRYGWSKKTENQSMDPATDISKRLNEFIDHKSGVDGVEFPTRESKETSTKVNFDPNEFSCAMQNILDLVIPDDDNWESESEMSDYESEANHATLDDEMKASSNKIKDYMNLMDKELAATTIGQSFERKQNADDDDDLFDDIEHFQPIDIDRNTLKNFVQSYQAQYGGPGPAENLLAPLGIRLDSDLDDLKLDD